MRLKSILFALLLGCLALQNSGAMAQSLISDRSMGDINAPITVQEFVSLTCSHCAEFYTKTLPELEKKYVETGKVRFILRDFPLDGVGLKAAAISRCMPEAQYYPFISLLYKSQAQWAFGQNPEASLLQYAKLGGLTEDKGKACLADEKLMDAIVAKRAEAADKYQVEATPTFVINNGEEVIKGGRSAEEFSAIFDRILATKK